MLALTSATPTRSTELARQRKADGRTTTGLKVGFANKAMWRALKLDTLVWAHMYDDTVRFAEPTPRHSPSGAMVAPKIEPEIVFKLKESVAGTDPGNDFCRRRMAGPRI